MNEHLHGCHVGLIDPELFAGVVDSLEDAMQASVSCVIGIGRVAEINQGDNPFQILILRALPDGQVKEMKENINKHNKKVKDPQEIAANEEDGQYYNL
jgi:thiamine pyrophosphate-dependent acetolactate synthase large subunit-like protein